MFIYTTDLENLFLSGPELLSCPEGCSLCPEDCRVRPEVCPEGPPRYCSVMSTWRCATTCFARNNSYMEREIDIHYCPPAAIQARNQGHERLGLFWGVVGGGGGGFIQGTH